VEFTWICGAHDSATFRHLSLVSHFAPIPGEPDAEAAFHAVPRSGSLDFPWDRATPPAKNEWPIITPPAENKPAEFHLQRRGTYFFKYRMTHFSNT
jgi:hypothetical protein